VKGRKRHLLVDTTGMILQVLVHEAGIQDHDGGKRLLKGVPTFFPPKIPAKVSGRSGRGLNNADSPGAWQQRKRYSGSFHSNGDQRGLLCRAKRHVSSQPTRLSGDFGRKKCRDPSLALFFVPFILKGR
jgi:hypothetical protein